MFIWNATPSRFIFKYELDKVNVDALKFLQAVAKPRSISYVGVLNLNKYRPFAIERLYSEKYKVLTAELGQSKRKTS